MTELLVLSCWVDARYEKNLNLSIKIGKRVPMLIKNYNPSTKIYLFDTFSPRPADSFNFDQQGSQSFRSESVASAASPSKSPIGNNTKQNENCNQKIKHLPIVEIEFKETKQIFELSLYPKENNTYCEVVKCSPPIGTPVGSTQAQEMKIYFSWEAMTKTKKLYERCNLLDILDCTEKSDIQKHFYCEGVKDFIRSEQQFLAQFDKNQEMDDLRELEAEQSSVEAELCQQIMNTKKFNISISKVVIICLIFLAIGYVFGDGSKELQPFKKGKSRRKASHFDMEDSENDQEKLQKVHERKPRNAKSRNSENKYRKNKASTKSKTPEKETKKSKAKRN